jgi:1-acyl-sn-glycerol-3-phosphate acyltransferase
MLRAFFVVVGVAIFLFFAGPFCVLYALIRRSPDILYAGGRTGSRLGLCLGGVKLVVRGQENVTPRRPFLFLANHQSYCDPPALFVSIPRNVRLILKKELRKLPLLGLIMEMGGFVFIDRKDRVQSVSGMKQAVRQLQQGHSFLIYPEGTRTRTGELGPFKKGPFIMAIESGTAIVPVSVKGSFEIMPPNRFSVKPGTVVVTFHRAIETNALSLSDREALTERVREAIAAGLVVASDPSVPPRPKTGNLQGHKERQELAR